MHPGDMLGTEVYCGRRRVSDNRMVRCTFPDRVGGRQYVNTSTGRLLCIRGGMVWKTHVESQKCTMYKGPARDDLDPSPI